MLTIDPAYRSGFASTVLTATGIVSFGPAGPEAGDDWLELAAGGLELVAGWLELVEGWRGAVED